MNFEPDFRRPEDFLPRLRISDDGLFFGGTKLIRMTVSKRGRRLATAEDADRCLGLLAVAYRRAIPKHILQHAEAACVFWDHDEPAVANFRLLFTGLPQLVDRTSLARVDLADHCLREGLAPSVLLRELGIAGSQRFKKYDPGQPRVPAGSGSVSGQWVKEGFSFLARLAPPVIATLTRFAAQFATPTAVLGALFIPTPNSGGVTTGTLPGASDISFEKDDPAGRLRLSAKTADGSTTVVEAQSRAGLYVAIPSGQLLGRDLDGQLYLDLDAVRQAITDASPKTAQGEPEEKPGASVSEPKLCPAPTPDTPHGASDDAVAYEDQVHRRVNPLAPLPSGFGVKLIDPLTGQQIFFEDCFRYAGDLVDRDMNIGDMVEAKGPRAGRLYDKQFSDSLSRDVSQAEKELRAADARGVGLKWYYADQDAADTARKEFAKNGLGQIVVGVMPLRKSYGWVS